MRCPKLRPKIGRTSNFLNDAPAEFSGLDVGGIGLPIPYGSYDLPSQFWRLVTAADCVQEVEVRPPCPPELANRIAACFLYCGGEIKCKNLEVERLGFLVVELEPQSLDGIPSAGMGSCWY